MQAVGHYASVHQPQARTVGSNVATIRSRRDGVYQLFNFRAISIAGGSDEVQRNIMAKLVLGL